MTRPAATSAGVESTRTDVPNLFAADVADPYPIYRALRTNPVQWSDDLDAWLLTDQVDVQAALRDTRLACRVPPVPAALPSDLEKLRPQLRALYEFRSLIVLHCEGTAHARLRRVVQRSFTATALETLRPSIQRLVDSLLDRVQSAGRMEVMADLAFPLPTATIALFLGIPLIDIERFTRWSVDALYAWPDAVDTPDPCETVRGAHAALEDLHAYVSGLVADRRNAPTADVVGSLAAAVEQGEVSAAEVAANLAFLSESGRNTTAYAIGNALHALLVEPSQLERLKQDMALTDLAIEELLRYDPPAMTVGRVALDDLEIGCASIRRGEHVMPLLCSANRDPANVADPDRLDVTRTRPEHLSFGAGRHYCAGAPLGRLEASTAITTLLRRLPGVRLAGAADWEAHPSFRRLVSLPISWDSPGAD